MSLIARLMEAGTPADLIEEVAMVLAEKKIAEQAIEERKRKANERQARKRERDAESRDVTQCHVTERDATDAPPSPSPKEINSNPHPHTPEHKPRAREADKFPCPEWCEPAVWRDLKANRRTKRLTNTPTAHRRFIEAIEAMADEHWPPGRLVEAIVAKGWGGPHDPREDRKPNNDNRKQPNSGRNTAQLALQKLGARQ